MLVTELGIVTEVSLELEKACWKIIFTLLSSTSEPEHSLPSTATPVGISTE